MTGLSPLPEPACLSYYPRSPTRSPATPFSQISSACQPASEASPLPSPLPRRSSGHTAAATADRPPPTRRLLRASLQVQCSWITPPHPPSPLQTHTYAMPCQAMPYHTIPYHTIPYHRSTIPYHSVPYHAMPCHTISCHAMPCHAMPCDVMPCHAMA